MNLKILRMIVVPMIILLNIPTAFAWTTFSDPSNGFQADFPCTPLKQEVSISDRNIKAYSCEESFRDNLILYQVNIASKINGDDIRYKKSDVSLALKNYLIGNLVVYGVSQNNITFKPIANFQNKFPAVFYYTNAMKGGVCAEGISSLINGKHVKIGIMYEPTIKDEAKSRLQHFLNSFKLQ
jgi:hypothetical protein